MTDLVIGSGGGGKSGGGGAGTPTEAKDNLDSKQFATVLDLIGEGELEGLIYPDPHFVNAIDGAANPWHQSIFFNNTPLQNRDGSYNFKDVIVHARSGQSNQASIPINENISTVVSTGFSEVSNSSPRVVQITDTDVEAVKVTITVPQLQKYSDEGDIEGTEVQLEIAVQYAGGSYNKRVQGDDGKITGRTGDLYQRDYLIRLDSSENWPVNIKVTRVTADSTSSKLFNVIQWNAYTLITYDQRNYNNSALVGVRLDAEQFTNIPTRKYFVKGIKVSVPHNATVRTSGYGVGSLSYSGTFNGTLGSAVSTNDPAWCLFDLLTSERYGLNLDVSDLDKFSFYAVSQYCSALVLDGKGGEEPRYSLNVNIQSAQEAYTVISQICSVFRGMSFWSAGSVSLTQDSPKDTSYLFTMANVLEPGFTYANSSQKTRATVAVVKYFDNDLRDYQYEEVKADPDVINRYGSIVKNIEAFGTTSRGQAHRLGRWLLYEHSANETCSFVTSIEAGVVCRPGDVIEIADELKAGERRSGRIKSATTTAITVDDSTNLTLGSNPTLAVILPDGSVESKTVSTISSGVITVSSAFSSAPNANSIWVYQTSDLQTSKWRVASVEEQDETNYAITCLTYNDGKYNHIERGWALDTRDVTNLNQVPDSPVSLNAEEVIYENTGRAKVKIIVTWTNSTDNVLLRWRYGSNNWTSVDVKRAKQYEILDTRVGDYQIEVSSVSASGLKSPEPAQLKPFKAIGKTAPPGQVTGISLLPVDEASALLKWNRATDLDVILGGSVLIRHSKLTTNAEWKDATPIVPPVSGDQTNIHVPLLSGTYLLKFRDDTDHDSPTPSNWDETRTTIDKPAPSERSPIYTLTEHTGSPFSGPKTNTVYDSTLGGLRLTESGSTVSATGQYIFFNSFDFGQIYDVNVRKDIKTTTFSNDVPWDSRTDLIDEWGVIDGNGTLKPDKCDAALYVRTTNVSPNVVTEADMGPWREFSNVLIRARVFQLKVVLTSEDTTQNISVSELGATLELQGRTESIATAVTTGTSAYSVTYAHGFKNAPNVVITPTNQQAGDYYLLSNITRTGFQVTFRNSGSNVARSFLWSASGFGKEIT